MQRNSPIKYAALLSTLLLSSTSFLAVAQEASQQKLPTEVSTLLNKLMSKKPKTSAPAPVKAAATSDADITPDSNEILTPGEFAKSQQGPAPIKSKPKPTIIAPRPVEISPSMPLDKVSQPKAKRSLPDFVHNIYIRADYGVGMPEKIEGTQFRRSLMYSGGIGYKFNQVLRADINFQSRALRSQSDRIRLLGRVQHSSIFLNAHCYLMDEESYIAPFVTAGIGYAKNRTKDFNIENVIITQGKTTTSSAWNIGAGAALRFNKYISIEGSYKFIDIGKVKLYSTVTDLTGTSSKVLNRRRHIHEISGGIVINL